MSTESPAPSLTASDSFRLRIQRSEETRALLMGGVFLVMLAITITRRLNGGAVMAHDALFITAAVTYAAGVAFELFAFARLRSATRRSVLVGRRHLDVAILIELAVPSVFLTAAHFWSPRGEYSALSGPTLLLFPLTTLVSILRLRPLATLTVGLAGALVQLALVLDTIRVADVDGSHVPVLLSYPILLALTGVGGMLVTSAARRYVSEAADEAVALEKASARLSEVDRDLEVARGIQSGLLPAGPPDFPGFEFAGMNIPAEKTGGDYYDWQALPDGRLLIVMADVTGHGIGPALVMAICRAYARASAPLTPDLNSLLVRLNSLLAADLRRARFITLAVALLDTRGRVQLLSAGHGPSMLFRAATGAVEQFGGDGLPLAIMPDESYGPIRNLDLVPGDVLVMLTDGLFEWFNLASEEYGTRRVAESLARSARKPAQEIMEDMHRAVLDFAGDSPQNDDLTIVVVKRSR